MNTVEYISEEESSSPISAVERLFENSVGTSNAEQYLQQPLATPPEVSTWWNVQNAMTVSSITLLFGLFVMGGALYILRHCKDPDQILKVLGTLLIIIGSIYLIIVGYDKDQLTPVIGLLGTIVGYLLGKDAGSTRADPEPDASADGAQAGKATPTSDGTG